jgi:hypothetical protein
MLPPHVKLLFPNVPPNSTMYKAVIEVDQRSFLAVGYQNPGLPPSNSLLKIKRSTLWSGEVIIFPISADATRYVKSSVSVPRAKIDFAAAMFVSRVTEACDTGKAPPSYIRISSI